MTPFEFLIYALATWRVSSLLVNEKGPFDIFLRLRGAVGIEHDPDGNKTIIPDGVLPGIFSCVWCASVWAGLFWMLSATFFPTGALWLATALAFSAVAVGVEKGMR